MFAKRGRTGLPDSGGEGYRIRSHASRGSMSLAQPEGGLPPDECGEDENDKLIGRRAGLTRYATLGEGLRRSNSGWMRRSVGDENEDDDDGVRAESAVQKDAVNRRLPPSNISREVGSESCHTSARWSIHGNVALITNEMTGFRIVDHNPVKV